MKKIYQTPATAIVSVKMQQLLAGSLPTELKSKDANGEGMGNAGGSLWDDED